MGLCRHYRALFIIWVIGPVFSIVDSRPLEPEQNRIISIALLYLVWGLGEAIPRLYNIWLNRKLMSSLETGKSDAPEADCQRLTSEEQVLAGRFSEATDMLKRRTSSATAARARRSGHSALAVSISISCRGT